MTHADEARRIVDAMKTCQTNHPEKWLEPIAAALAAAERRGIERALAEAWKKEKTRGPSGLRARGICEVRVAIRALLPESSGNPGELPAEPAAKCDCDDPRVRECALVSLEEPAAKCATCGITHPAHHSCTPAMDPPKCATCGSKGKVVDTVQATHVSGRGHENLITYQPCPACAVGGGK